VCDKCTSASFQFVRFQARVAASRSRACPAHARQEQGKALGLASGQAHCEEDSLINQSAHCIPRVQMQAC